MRVWEGSMFPYCGWMEVCISTLVAALSLLLLWKLRIAKNSIGMPPGAAWMLPVIGETLNFLNNPHTFYLKRVARYGGIFSTSLFGDLCIVVTTPDASKFVLQSGQKYFKPAYPESANSLIDPTGSFSDQNLHSLVRRTVGSCLHPEALQYHLSYIEKMASATIAFWTRRDIPSVNVYNDMAKFTFVVAMKIFCGIEQCPELDNMFQNMRHFENAFVSLNINLPFTKYRRGLKARDILFRDVERLIQERRATLEGSHHDMLESLVHDSECKANFTDVHVRGIVMTLLFAGHETSAAQLVWLVKHLHDNPGLLLQLKEEHEAIRRRNSEGLKWQDLKEMQLSSKVINETLRISYISQFIPRECLQDIEYNGFHFPKGCKVYASPSTMHMNPEYYPNPYKFDPSRFQNVPNTFIPFGNGNRTCLGSELAKCEMLVFMHHLVTKCRWRMKNKEEGIRWWPVPIPKQGLVVNIEPL